MKKLQKEMQKARKDIHRGKMANIITHKDMSRLTKFAKNGKMKEVGLTKNATGNLATSPDEAVDNLCKAHFPSATNINDTDMREDIEHAHVRKGEAPVREYTWINDVIIAKAIRSFGSNKAPGMD